MFNLKVNDFGGMILIKFDNFETNDNNFFIAVDENGIIQVSGEDTSVVDIGGIVQNEWNFIA